MSRHKFKYVTGLSQQWANYLTPESGWWSEENPDDEQFVPGEHSTLREGSMGSGEEFDYEVFFNEFMNELSPHTDTENNTLPPYSDYDASVFVYKYLKPKGMTAQIAANKEIWLYMCLVHFKKYVWMRWRGTDYESRMTVKGGVRRNALARLWRYAYLTHDAEASDPYHLTVFPFNLNVFNFTSDTLLPANRPVWLATLKYIKNNAETANTSSFCKDFLPLVRIKNAVVKLNLLDTDELNDRMLSIAGQV